MQRYLLRGSCSYLTRSSVRTLSLSQLNCERFHSLHANKVVWSHPTNCVCLFLPGTQLCVGAKLHLGRAQDKQVSRGSRALETQLYCGLYVCPLHYRGKQKLKRNQYLNLESEVATNNTGKSSLRQWFGSPFSLCSHMSTTGWRLCCA
jgi:hypothetical protein